MDGELLRCLYHRLLHDPTLARRRDCTYGEGIILLIYFFSVLCNQSLLWSHDKCHWPIWCRGLPLKWPSYSQLCRRLKTASIRSLIDRINAELRDLLPHGQDKVGDGKPLIISGYSHDPDARWGKVAQRVWAKGYKLHVIVDAAAAVIDAFELTALNAGEATVLRGKLIKRLDLRGCTLRADANYDSNPTYRALARMGGKLVAQRRKPGTGIGHHRQHPDRLAAIAELEKTPGGLPKHKRQRNRVEQTLAHLTNLSFGLWALPNHVRRLSRVQMWVAAKVTLYHLHKVLALSRSAAPAAA
jgi:hypothetical protein